MARTLAILNGYRPFIINASEERSIKLLIKKIFNQLEYNTTFRYCPVCDVDKYKEAGKFYGNQRTDVSVKFHECLKNPPLVILDEVDGIATTNNETLIDQIINKLYFDNQVTFIFFISN
jgi:Cdc6-like AAA superfamily ATPase